VKKIAAKSTKKPMKQTGPRARPAATPPTARRVKARGAAPALPAARQDLKALLAARAASAASVPTEPVSRDRLVRMVEARLRQRAGEFELARAGFERVAKALQGLVVSASADTGPVKGGPRRFRPAPAQAREYQQQMAELSTEMRLGTARRAELVWVRQLLGGAPPKKT